MKSVSLCPSPASARNHEGAGIAGIAIRTPAARAATTERRLDLRAFEIGRENLPGRIGHDLVGGQDAVANQRADRVTCDAEPPRGVQHREARIILHRRLVPRDASFAAMVSDTAAIPGIPLAGRQSESVEGDRDLGI